MFTSKLLYTSLLVMIGQLLLAQGNIENYLVFNDDCMKKYDYKRSSTYHDTPFWDFHFKASPNQTFIFRVLKQKEYQSEAGKLDHRPMTCEDARLITNEFIAEVNSLRKTVYIAQYNSEKESYQLFQVQKIIPFTETITKLSYKDSHHQFTYHFNEIAEGKDLDATKEGKVLFMDSEPKSCLRVRKFRAFDRVQPRLHDELHFISGVGLYKIVSNQGSLELSSINDKPLEMHIGMMCNALAGRSIKNNTAVKTGKKDLITPSDDLIDKNGNADRLGDDLPNPFESNTSTADIKKDVDISPVNQLDATGHYTVQEGDNLYKIAQKFNTQVHVIKTLNKLETNAIDAKQRLKIPQNQLVSDQNPYVKVDANTGNQVKVHVVRQGESLWKIAQKYNMKTTELRQLNQLASDALDVQQELVIGYIQSN